MTASQFNILIVEDDPLLRDWLTTLFENEGYPTRQAATVAQGLRHIDEERVDLAIMDYWLPDGKGTDVIRHLREVNPGGQAIVVSGFGSDRLAGDVIRDGAFAFLHKPFDMETILEYSRRALSHCLVSRENESLQSVMREFDEKLAYQEKELSGLSRIATITYEKDDFDQHGEEALNIVRESLGSDAALMYYINPPSNGRLVLKLHHGISEEEKNDLSELDCAMGLVGQVGMERKLIAEENLNENPIGHNTVNGEPVKLERMKKAIACPIFAKNQLLGVLLAGYHEDQEFIEEKERIMMGSLGRQFGIAVKNSYLSEQATVDGLTNLYNRRYFDLRFAQEFSRCKRHGHDMTLMMADIDRFKSLNDTYGHPVGDRVLRAVSQCFRSKVRMSDFAARYGGEELSTVFPETGIEGGLRVAEKILQSIRNLEVPCRKGEESISIKVGLNIGLSAFPAHGDTPEKILEKAGEALGRAKAEGGDCIVCA